MIDFAHLEQYRENNRIEAKKALGGLPKSIWETYSAFANTMGGVILLGVEERADKSLHPVGLPDPQRLVREFWDTVAHTTKVSANILSGSSVTIEPTGSGPIIVIAVPRAQRADRPVYLDESPLTETYRRSGEGDYRCSQEEVRSMLRDAAVQTPDMALLDGLALDVLAPDTLRRYRARLQACRPGRAWEDQPDAVFLQSIGAAGPGADGALHPTAAGLLLFGHERGILREFPFYCLDYQEQDAPDAPCVSRIVSSSGGWSGNLYDFYFGVRERLAQAPFCPSDASVHRALDEALTNCLVNADYYGRQGIVIVRRPDAITFSNPGGFRIDLDAARSGGVSDPRNSALTRMLSLIDIGKGMGSGIPSIYSVWNARGWPPPVIQEHFQPDRITLSLSFSAGGRSAGAAPASAAPSAGRSSIQEAAIVEYLTQHPEASSAELSALLGVRASRTRQLLARLIQNQIITPRGAARSRRYRLKR